jgi:hypothetical protein
VEIEKSFVNRTDKPAAVCLWLTWKLCSFAADRILQLRREYDEGDTVKLGVRDRGVLKAKKMDVARAELKEGKWMYQVKPSGGGNGEVLHRDENGKDWFKEDELEWG